MNLDELASKLTEFGSGYLLTVTTAGTVKAVNATPRVVDGGLLVERPGKGSLANAADRPSVTLLFPPPEAGGYTLLVDGEASVGDDALRITPGSAVLHRPAEADGPVPEGECGNDCARL